MQQLQALRDQAVTTASNAIAAVLGKMHLRAAVHRKLTKSLCAALDPEKVKGLGGPVEAVAKVAGPILGSALRSVEPWAYLRDIFCLLPDWPEHELLDLAPLRWPKTAARDDVRARLDANRFRALTLDARG